jgi:hypothetical protein
MRPNRFTASEDDTNSDPATLRWPEMTEATAVRCSAEMSSARYTDTSAASVQPDIHRSALSVTSRNTPSTNIATEMVSTASRLEPRRRQRLAAASPNA